MTATTQVVQHIETMEVILKLYKHTELTPLENEIVKRHYGFSPYARDVQSFEEIAEYMGYPVDFVEKIHANAIAKYRETVKKHNITWKGFSL